MADRGKIPTDIHKLFFMVLSNISCLFAEAVNRVTVSVVFKGSRGNVSVTVSGMNYSKHPESFQKINAAGKEEM